MLEELKRQVLEANLALVKYGLVLFTWGNASAIDRESRTVIIKPSGVPYEDMTVDDLVCLDLANGNITEGTRKPSSDAPTHLLIYRTFPEIGGVVHTHSRFATVFAQAGNPVPALGTTHADYFHGDVPVTRPLTQDEIAGDYELNTGLVITEAVGSRGPLDVPAALVWKHGPFAWGKNAMEAAYHAAVLEEAANMAWHTLMLNEGARFDEALLNKHYLRKHGKNAYYGQEN